MSVPTTAEFDAAFAAVGLAPLSVWRIDVRGSRASIATPWEMPASVIGVKGGAEINLPLPLLSQKGVDALLRHCGIEVSEWDALGSPTRLFHMYSERREAAPDVTVDSTNEPVPAQVAPTSSTPAPRLGGARFD
jgi:hypothetical protein